MNWFTNLFSRKKVPVPSTSYAGERQKVNAVYQASLSAQQNVANVGYGQRPTSVTLGASYGNYSFTPQPTVIVDTNSGMFGMGPLGDAIVLNELLSSRAEHTVVVHDAPAPPAADPVHSAPDPTPSYEPSPSFTDSSPSYDPSPSYSDSSSSYDSGSSYSDSSSSSSSD